MLRDGHERPSTAHDRAAGSTEGAKVLWGMRLTLSVDRASTPAVEAEEPDRFLRKRDGLLGLVFLLGRLLQPERCEDRCAKPANRKHLPQLVRRSRTRARTWLQTH